jgi:hypothetical protein
MGNARSFSDLYYEMNSEDLHQYLMGLAQLKVHGMTYKAIGGLTDIRPASLVTPLKKYERLYKDICCANLDNLEKSLVRVDPDYDYMVDQRTVHQQMCALLMGGDEIKSTLEQLTGVNK